MRSPHLAGLALSLSACSPFAGVQRDRAQDLAAIAEKPAPEQAKLLRVRVLRDGMNARMRGVPGAIGDATLVAIVARAPDALAEDYLRLAGALQAAGDPDGALGAYEDALAEGGRMQGRGEEQARVRGAVLRGEEALFRASNEAVRAEATRVLAASEERPGPPEARGPIVVARLDGLPARPDLAPLHRLGAILAQSPGNATAVLAALEAIRRGASIPAVERSLQALAASPAAPGPAAAGVSPGVGPAASGPSPGAGPAAAGVPPGAGPPGAVAPPGAGAAAVGAPPGARPPLGPAPAAGAPSAGPLPALPATPGAGAPAAPAAKGDVGARLKKLDDLRAHKLITDQEYFRERARILKEGL